MAEYDELMRHRGPDFDGFLRGLRDQEAGREGTRQDGGLEDALAQARRAELNSQGTASTFGRGGASRGLDGASGERGLEAEANPTGTQQHAASKVQALWRGK